MNLIRSFINLYRTEKYVYYHATLNELEQSDRMNYRLEAFIQMAKDAGCESTKKIKLYLGDRYPITPRTLSYSSKSNNYKWVIPDFVFDKHDYAKVNSYPEYTLSLLKTGKDNQPKHNKIAWSGNAYCHDIRLTLMQLAKQHPDKLFANHFADQDIRPDYNFSNDFIELTELVKDYKYLIDLEGIGYSSRVKLLLHTNRLLFLQDRPLKEYFFAWLKPNVHYVPVKRDLSDLLEKYEWAENNPETVAQIIENANHFAKEYLTKDFALALLKTTFDRY